jgi:peptide/nickel transport system substrate-binding protein
MTVGFLGNGTSETVNPALAVAPVDLMRSHQLFDLLWTVAPDVKSLIPGLAVSAEPSADAKTWTVTLRSGVEWHDGSALTADDLVWTIALWAEPSSYVYGALAPAIDWKGVRKRGPLTVEIPLIRGISSLPSLLCLYNCGILKNGMSLKQVSANPVGTGPYKYVSFTPGQRSEFSANDDYWGGRPPIDSLVVDSTFSDDTARVNALLSGVIEVAPNIPFLVAQQHQSTAEVVLLRAHAPNAYYFSMRVDRPPFNDVRVRQAMKYVADRPALVSNAFAGFGTVGNDLIAEGTQYFASDLQRSQDIEQAKSLLKSAGQPGLTVTLQTADAGPGLVAAATLFAEQAKAAGVTVNLQTLQPTVYFTSAGGFLTRAFGQNLTNTYPSLAEAYILTLWSGAPYNDTHWGAGPGQSNGLFFEALSELDPGRAGDLWHEVQEAQFTQGGYIVWGNSDYIDAVAPNVRGLRTTAAYPLNNYDFTHAALA